MPTGYTSYLIENPEATLPEFAWRCARAMGFCVMQREDSSDAPVEMEEQPSDFYLVRLKEACRELAKVSAMTPEQWAEEDARNIAELVERETKADDKRDSQISSYRRMLKLVEDWKPPAELDGMKEFMVQQITQSIRFDAPIRDTHPEWLEHKPTPLADKITQLREYIHRYQKHHDEEVERVNDRNRYKRLLKESLDQLENAATA